jgi:hypothetical protein
MSRELRCAKSRAIPDQPGPTKRAARAEKRRSNRGRRICRGIIVDLNDTICPYCRGKLYRSVRTSASDLTWCRRSSGCWWPRPPEICLPHMRGRCRASCGAGAPYEGGLPTEATVAQVLVSKYADHLPLLVHVAAATESNYGSSSPMSPKTFRISLRRFTIKNGFTQRSAISAPCNSRVTHPANGQISSLTCPLQ